MSQHCPEHEKPLIEGRIEQLEFKDFIFDFHRRLHENKLKVKSAISERHFDWLRPIYDSTEYSKLVDLNRQLLDFHDDETLKRTSKRHNNYVDTKIFSFAEFSSYLV